MDWSTLRADYLATFKANDQLSYTPDGGAAQALKYVLLEQSTEQKTDDRGTHDEQTAIVLIETTSLTPALRDAVGMSGQTWVVDRVDETPMGMAKLTLKSTEQIERANRDHRHRG